MLEVISYWILSRRTCKYNLCTVASGIAKYANYPCHYRFLICAKSIDIWKSEVILCILFYFLCPKCRLIKQGHCEVGSGQAGDVGGCNTFIFIVWLPLLDPVPFTNDLKITINLQLYISCVGHFHEVFQNLFWIESYKWAYICYIQTCTRVQELEIGDIQKIGAFLLMDGQLSLPSPPLVAPLEG